MTIQINYKKDTKGNLNMIFAPFYSFGLKINKNYQTKRSINNE